MGVAFKGPSIGLLERERMEGDRFPAGDKDGEITSMLYPQPYYLTAWKAAASTVGKGR
jgi:hypothetical protein